MTRRLTWEAPSLVALPVSATAWANGTTLDVIGPGAMHVIEQDPQPPRSPQSHRPGARAAAGPSTAGPHKRAWEAPRCAVLAI
jgi:hypothetical protein